MTKAVAYYRTSSVNGVGDDKDSLKRQEDIIKQFSKREKYIVVESFYDAAVKGTDPVDTREQFSQMLAYMSENKITTILVENASRFARDLTVQLTGHSFLQKKGITLIPVDAPDYFTDETPTAVMVRQILGAVSQFERASLVDKMRKARDRQRQTNGRCEGRKPPVPEAVTLAKELRKQNLSYQQIGFKLAEAGYYVMKKDGVSTEVYKAASVRHMLLKRRA